MRLLGRRDEFFGKLRSCAKEILLHLLDEELLCLRLPGLEPIFIEQHLGMLSPHAPRFSAYVFINLLAQFGIERAFIQAGKFASKLCAFDHTRHGNIVTRGGEREGCQCTHPEVIGAGVKRIKRSTIAFCSPKVVNCFLSFERGKYGSIVFYQGGMAGCAGNGGHAGRGAVQRDLDVDHAGAWLGTTILSGDPRSGPAGKMAHREKPKDLYKDGGKARSGEDGAARSTI